MLHDRLPIPSFNALRSAMECSRLLWLFMEDEEFRKEYISNPNKIFDKDPDYKFTQGKVCKKLEKIEQELRSQEKIPFTLKLLNHQFQKDSAFSRLHTELSKWSHILNRNLLTTALVNNGKIYLGIDDEYDEPMQLLIRKYIEGCYIMVCNQDLLFLSSSDYTKEQIELSEKMLNLYEQYMKIAH